MSAATEMVAMGNTADATVIAIMGMAVWAVLGRGDARLPGLLFNRSQRAMTSNETRKMDHEPMAMTRARARHLVASHFGFRSCIGLTQRIRGSPAKRNPMT